jgi:hypothetical protein
MRFTTRDLLWLTVVAALAMGWFLDRRKLGKAEADRDQLLHAVQSQIEVTKAAVSKLPSPENP